MNAAEIHVGPPDGWDPDEATERIRASAHARLEHKRWLQETDDKGNLIHGCDRCGVTL